MWKDSMKELGEKFEKKGKRINEGASNQEIMQVCDKFEEKFGRKIPEGYTNFLKLVNGMEHNGQIIYGVDPEYLVKKQNQIVDGVLDSNLVWYDNEWEEGYVFLGDGDMDAYIYCPKTEKYCVADKGCVDDIFEEFDTFEELLEVILRKALL